MDCFPSKRLMKVVVLMVLASIVLWLYMYSGVYSPTWAAQRIVFSSPSGSEQILAAPTEGPVKQEQKLEHKQEQKLEHKQEQKLEHKQEQKLEHKQDEEVIHVLPDLHLNITANKRIPLERVKLPPGVNTSGIYISVLTMPRNHPTRFAAHLFTWMQTVNPSQVRVITELSDDEMINGAKQMGYHVVPSGCPDVGNHDARVMCCKSGRQFEEYYRARKAGEKYNWYCHADDDIYVNVVGLTKMLKSYNPNQKVYLGQWYLLQKYFFHTPRVIHLAPGLLSFTERKRDNFRYSSGNTYCISDPLMMELEKYLSGQNYVTSCAKAEVSMDDVLVGVVIDGILGYDLIEPRNFRTELDSYEEFSENDLKRAATVALGRVIVPKTKFGADDKTRLLSYHCFIYPDVSWCAMG